AGPGDHPAFPTRRASDLASAATSSGSPAMSPPERARSGTLYIVATPLGNLGDISSRALEVLGAVHQVAAEDTRHSARLLQHFGIDRKSTRLNSSHVKISY